MDDREPTLQELKEEVEGLRKGLYALATIVGAVATAAGVRLEVDTLSATPGISASAAKKDETVH